MPGSSWNASALLQHHRRPLIRSSSATWCASRSSWCGRYLGRRDSWNARSAEALIDHPKVPILAGLPRIGSCVNLAQIVAEVGPVLDGSLNVDHAAAQCRASPVTKASGQSRGVHFRWAANVRARKALQTFADNSRHASPWAAQLYAQHIALRTRFLDRLRGTNT